MQEQVDAIHGRNDWGLFGGRAGARQQNPDQGEISLEQAVNNRQNDLSEEADNEDCVSALIHQLGSDERIIEALVQLLCGNDNVECELIPCIA